MKARQLGSRTLALPSVLNSETQPEHWTVGVLVKRRFIEHNRSRIGDRMGLSRETANATQVVLKTPIRAGRINRFS